jgi:hypothetical protein
MQTLLVDLQFVVLFGVVPYAIAVIMPSWRTLAVCAMLIGGGFAYLWIDQWIVQQSPHYKEGPGAGIGFAIMGIATISFVVGVAARAVSLSLRWMGWSVNLSFAINVTGFLVVVGVVAVPELWLKWRMRPLSTGCAHARFAVDIGGARLRVPGSALFNVYFGATSARDVVYLWSIPDWRSFCARTNLGERPVRATHLWLDIEGNHSLNQMTCADVEPVLGPNSCAAFALMQRGRAAATDYPLGAHVFAPDEVRFGEFGATRSTYADASNGTRSVSYPEFFRTGRILADGTPLTFACRKSGNGHYCRSAYPWCDGAYLDYDFTAGANDVVEKGLRVDTKVHEIFDAMSAASH